MLTLKLYSATGAFLRSVEIDAREQDYCIDTSRGSASTTVPSAFPSWRSSSRSALRPLPNRSGNAQGSAMQTVTPAPNRR
jgi:hypothetical protein